MARNRIVRKTTETNTTFQTYGYFLTEKMKAKLRKSLGKTDNLSWADLFPHCDVVYRWNEDKQKQDVFVGVVTKVKYPSGKVVSLKYPSDYYVDLNTIESITNRYSIDRTNLTVNQRTARRTTL